MFEKYMIAGFKNESFDVSMSVADFEHIISGVAAINFHNHSN